jgi:hypothetical protein
MPVPLRAPQARNQYTLRQLYSWIANGAISSRDRDCANSALSRYAPFYARGWQHKLTQSQRDAFWYALQAVVSAADKRHYGYSIGTQMAMLKISYEDHSERLRDIMLMFITEWLPQCVSHAADFTTLGDYAVYAFYKCYPAILMRWDMETQHGIAGVFSTDGKMPMRVGHLHMLAMIGFTYWQKHPVQEPLQWLREHNYITSRSTPARVNTLLAKWQQIAICCANVPHTSRFSYAGGMCYTKGYTLPEEVEAAGEPLDVQYTIC